jgi:hypothetical protein
MEIEHLGPALGKLGFGIECLGMRMAALSPAGDPVLWRFAWQKMGTRPFYGSEMWQIAPLPAIYWYAAVRNLRAGRLSGLAARCLMAGGR